MPNSNKKKSSSIIVILQFHLKYKLIYLVVLEKGFPFKCKLIYFQKFFLHSDVGIWRIP